MSSAGRRRAKLRKDCNTSFEKHFLTTLIYINRFVPSTFPQLR